MAGYLKNTLTENSSDLNKHITMAKRTPSSRYWFEEDTFGWMKDYAIRAYFGFSIFGKFKTIMFEPTEIELVFLGSVELIS